MVVYIYIHPYIHKILLYIIKVTAKNVFIYHLESE